MEGEWAPVSYVGGARNVDTTPSEDEIRCLQTRFTEYYPEHKVDLERDTVSYKWVTGFQRRSDMKVKYKDGDDLEIIFPGTSKWLGRIDKSLEVTVAGRVYYFSFLHWYEEQEGSMYVRRLYGAKFVRKWPDNEQTNLPVTPRVFGNRVMIQHYCLRGCQGCRRLKCNCVRCHIALFCDHHNAFDCSALDCHHQKRSVDRHHPSINEYTVIDSTCGFKDYL